MQVDNWILDWPVLFSAYNTFVMILLHLLSDLIQAFEMLSHAHESFLYLWKCLTLIVIYDFCRLSGTPASSLTGTPSSSLYAKSRTHDEATIWGPRAPGSHATFPWRTSYGTEKRSRLVPWVFALVKKTP